ncbi:MAG: carboxypeptidase-like regulatory domain-containing protein, partial [Demequinaceae bacterium]|nr:carboxypeptidase-like regulatory domain-containing protein [Demequinaceae bacterium]
MPRKPRFFIRLGAVMAALLAIGGWIPAASAVSAIVGFTLEGDHSYVAGEEVGLGINFSDTTYSGVAEVQVWDPDTSAWITSLEYDMVDGVVDAHVYVIDGKGVSDQWRALVDGVASEPINVTMDAFWSSVTGSMDFSAGQPSSLTVTTNADYMNVPANLYFWDNVSDEWVFYTTIAMTNGIGTFQPHGWRSATYVIGFYEETGEYETFFSDEFDVDVELGTPGTISGTVTRSTDAPATNPDGSRAVWVYGYNATVGQWEVVTGGLDVTDGSGAYSLPGLASGDYKVGFRDDAMNTAFLTPESYHWCEFEAACPYWAGWVDAPSEYWLDQPDLASAEIVTVTAGGTATADAVLEPVAGTIAGTLDVPDTFVSSAACVGAYDSTDELCATACGMV